MDKSTAMGIAVLAAGVIAAAASVTSAILSWKEHRLSRPQFKYELFSGGLVVVPKRGPVSPSVEVNLASCSGEKHGSDIPHIEAIKADISIDAFTTQRRTVYVSNDLIALVEQTGCVGELMKTEIVLVHAGRTIVLPWPTGVGKAQRT